MPVMLEEAIAGLAVRPGGLYVDATYGAGGHTAALVDRVGPRGRVIALDVDPSAAERAAERIGVDLVHANFADLRAVLDTRGIGEVDGVLFDFGVSSMQLDRPERGFSWRDDAPLDMRLDPTHGRTAAELLFYSGEAELARIFWEYGEERAARRIARAIGMARASGRLPQRTTDLARLVSGVVRVAGRRERIHPATRVFQALRIAVNGELDAIRIGLDAAIERTRAGGRIVAISFHSLEDRIVKQTFRDDQRVVAVTRRPLAAGPHEVAHNPRARSAKLRIAERLA